MAPAESVEVSPEQIGICASQMRLFGALVDARKPQYKSLARLWCLVANGQSELLGDVEITKDFNAAIESPPIGAPHLTVGNDLLKATADPRYSEALDLSWRMNLATATTSTVQAAGSQMRQQTLPWPRAL